MPAPSSRKDHDDWAYPNGSVKMADRYGRRKLPIMVRQGRKSQKPSWPFMELWGLYRRRIAADGNCLFRSLSDQLYNTTKRHGEIRQRIVEYLRTHRSHFEPFVLANVEDDVIRSQPTTRSSRSRKSSVDQDSFEVYLENMAKPNTWGGDIEITAFCEVFDKDVLIHRPTGSEKAFTQVVNSKRAAGQPKEHVHISFGDETSFAHYESVRPRKNAPDTLPAVTDSTSTINMALCGPAERHLSLTEYHNDSLSKIHKARPTLSHKELHAFLEESRRQLDETFGSIIATDRERSSSASSTSERSSSSKRSREDDDGDSDRAPKRTLRRISLRNKTRAFISYTSPPSSSNGTEISFSIRVDSPPNTPTDTRDPQRETSEGETKETGKGKSPEGEDGPKGQEAAKEETERPVPPGLPKQEDGHSASPAKTQGPRGRPKSRAKNA